MKGILYFSLSLLVALASAMSALASSSVGPAAFSCDDVTEIPLPECAALVALYNSTGGSNWADHTNWMETNTPGNWFGVSIIAGHVATVDLNYNNLLGNLPPELGSLTYLRTLALYGNQLSGSIPRELGSLGLLTQLFMSSNQLSGPIPEELGNLGLLVELGLSWNALEGLLPDSLGNLSRLEVLSINNNPGIFGPLPLTLTSLPLLYFMFDNTGLCEPTDPSFQSWLNSIPHLYRTGITCQAYSCADVSEIPQAECEALVALYESTNGINWRDHSNWLQTSTPSNWYGLVVNDGHVNSLFLGSNNLNGTLPSQLGDLAYLFDLDLGWNKLSGSLPPELGNLTRLSNLILLYNLLTGPIPPEIGSLNNLITLNLIHNNLDGSLPPEIGNLSNLTELDLGDNQLSGSIPPELGNLNKLATLDLCNNQFSGNLPPELGNMSSLYYLCLSNNQFSGSLPPELGNLLNLSIVYIAFNQISGTLPVELGNLVNLAQLDLSSNLFEGSIPGELGNLINLYHLSLRDNQLSGNIPPELGNLIFLNTLSLSGNQLNSIIPPELGNLTNLELLRLQDNQFTGDIPDSLKNLVKICDSGLYSEDCLDLDYNMLNIPPGYPDPGNPLHAFLLQKNPGWQFYQGFEQVIETGGGEITSRDGKVDILIPPGALVTDTTFTYMPFPSPRQPNFRMAFAHTSFGLSAADLAGFPVTDFILPITATLTYTDVDFGGLPEDALVVDYWNSGQSAWIDAVTTCPDGAYIRDMENNRLILPLCHLTEFGLFTPPFEIFAPIVEHDE